MDYCGPRGIPHSIFLGRVPGEGEPHWLDSDREKAVAWARRDRSRCGNCGIPPEDLDPARGGHPEAYKVEQEWCQTCRDREMATAEAEEMSPMYRRGLRTYLVPNVELRHVWQYP